MSMSPAPTSVPSVHRAAGERPFPERGFRQEWMAFRTLATWMMRSAQRRALRELSQEGRLLADIGLTREQALAEAVKPFWRR
jgi:uncharacterized protein YjiS (DUF1127 family)